MPIYGFVEYLEESRQAGAIFSLAHGKDPTLLLPNFDHAVQDLLNMSKRYSLIQAQRLHAVIRKEQAQRKRPI